jgi:hypothetical protein
VRDEQWKKQYEHLVEFKRKNGHCIVSTCKNAGNKPLGIWVRTQSKRQANNVMRRDRKELLDEIGFVWKADNLAARASTTDVSCRQLHRFTLYSVHFSHPPSFSAYNLCALEFGCRSKCGSSKRNASRRNGPWARPR